MTISTYYEPIECEVCGSQTNYVEAIAIRIGIDSDTISSPLSWHRVCPTCYAKAYKEFKEENA